jgi:hypothetical protein
VYICEQITKAIRQLLWGIAVPAVYFGASNYWLAGSRAFLGLESTTSLILVIDFSAAFALTSQLRLAGLTDHRKYSLYQAEHLEQIQRHNRTTQNTVRTLVKPALN